MLHWLPTLLLWYGMLVSASLLSLPIGSYLFHSLPDKGYPLYRVITIGIVGYIVFVLGRYAIAPFTLFTILSVIGIYSGVQLIILHFTKAKLSFPSWRTITNYEVIFLIFFLTGSYIRGQEPSLRSLEKFMDLGFTMSAYRSTSLPPPDMWYAGHTINYYYFGHYLTALLSKVTVIIPNISYNFMLETILAVSVTASFSLGAGLYRLLMPQIDRKREIVAGVISSFVLNFGGNLHTIYLFTKGYTGDNPAPFWRIWSGWNPNGYWYPNATRFIPFTIHEFPSYSYVVADLHGHLINLMHVLVIYGLFLTLLVSKDSQWRKSIVLFVISLFLAISYMTNASDLLVYLGLSLLVLTVAYVHLRPVAIRYLALAITSFALILPFASRFQQFSNSIGINCAPQALVSLGSFGPFIAEAGKCQSSPLWMLAILWGFFWFVGAIFLGWIFSRKKIPTNLNYQYFLFFTFAFSIILTFTAEFIYFKDIYPNHFRANTMFKLGYQAYILMALGSGPIIVAFLRYVRSKPHILNISITLVLLAMLFLVSIYSLFGIGSYYGPLGKFKTLDGSAWIQETYPDVYHVITLLRNKDRKGEVTGNILESHGDSYTDFNVVSAHTGIPTVVGWAVHEWLWRKDYGAIVVPRAADVTTLYTSKDVSTVRKLLKKYNVQYVLVSPQEREKYPSLNSDIWYILGKPIYQHNGTYLFELSGNE